MSLCKRLEISIFVLTFSTIIMNTQLVKSLLLATFIGGTATSCTKEQMVQPTSPTNITTSAIQVVNGRLLFADLKTFEQARQALENKLSQASDSQVLDDWENNLHYTSLRAVAALQSKSLEELDAQKKSTTEYDLMVKFGFPAFYATLINPSGEYQIGSKIYWFHDGNKYEASSEDELASIKQNPLSAKVKHFAGTKIIKSTQLPLDGSTNRTIGSRNPLDDYKYHYEFLLFNQSGNDRRIMYNIRIYVEDRGTDPSVSYKQFYTNLSLLIKYEYYSYGNRAWYPSQGRGSQLDWSTAINFTGTALTPNPASTPTSQSSSSYRSFSFDNGVVGISLGDATIYAFVATQDYTANDVTWDYEISGNINAYPDNDRNHSYPISGNVLW